MNNLAYNIERGSFIRSFAAASAGMLCFSKSMLAGNIFDQAGKRDTRTALYWENSARGVQCGLCPNSCVIAEGKTGLCGVRKVKNSQLYTISYGNPCTANIDPIEKKPLYHFLPGSRAFSIATAGCNLACLNCQNWTISRATPEETRNYDLMPEEVASKALSGECSIVAYTYTEPVTFFEYAYDSAVIARENGLKNIIKSSGYINHEPLKQWCKVMDAANIDLKAFNNETYLKLTGVRLQPVLDTLKILKDNGVWLEITNLIVPSWTDNPDEIRAMCKWLNDNGFSDTPLHFSRFYPMFKLDQLPPTPVDTLFEAAKIATEEGIKFVYIGNVPGNDKEDTKCPKCGATVLERQGFSILSNSVADGKCASCGKSIPGVFI